MTKKPILFLILLMLCALSVSAFYVHDDFSSGLSTALYTNQSHLNSCDLTANNATIRFNGSNCGGGGTFFQTKNFIASSMDGNLTFKFKAVVNGAGDNDHYKLGAFNLLTGGLYISKDVDQVYTAHDFPTSARLCTGDQKTPDNNWHTIAITITRGRNSTGAAKNTSYIITYDGDAWCSDFQANTVNLYANFSDNTASGAGHDYLIDDLTFTDGNYTTNCDSCGLPCLIYDTFDYSTYLENCRWSIYPRTSYTTQTYPTAGQLCYDGSAGIKTYDLSFFLSGTTIYPMYSEEFDLTVDGNGFIEKSFGYGLFSGGVQTSQASAYKLSWTNDTAHTYIYSTQNTSNTTTQELVCSDCWTAGVKTHYRINNYNRYASGYTWFNSSSNTMVAIQPNSVTLTINYGASFLLRGLQGVTNVNGWVPNENVLILGSANVCFDNYVMYQGENINAIVANTSTNITTPGSVATGEYCKTNVDCYTGLCDARRCQLRPGGMSCQYFDQCISGKCINGKCGVQTLGQSVDAAKTSLFGNDAATNNLLSLIFAVVLALVVGIVIADLTKGAGTFAALGAGVAFFIAMIFFSIFGWLSPFIVIGLFLLVVFGTVAIIILGSR